MKQFKKVLALFLVLCTMATLVVSCGSKVQPSTPAGSETSEKKMKDTLTWVQSADVFSFDPNIGKETTAIQVTGNIYDTLLTVDSNMELQPMLAKSWKQEDDRTYLFNLRDDVLFHDGSKFTAEDAKYSIERAVASPSVNYIANFVDSVEVVDEYTIRLKTLEPYAPTLRNLTHPGMGMTSKAYAEANGEDILKTKPMGTGPFKFVEWKQGDYVKLDRFDEYWDGPAPMAHLLMRVVPETAQRTIALETGEADIAYDISPNDLERLQKNEGTDVLSVPSLMCYYIGMNFTNEYLGNQKVREAIRLAIDPKPIISAVMYGGAAEADTVLAPACFGYQADMPDLKHDVEEAKKLMVEAGYADGFPLKITVSDDQTRVEICSVIQSQLKELNIDLTLDVVEQARYVETVNNGRHELCMQNWTTATADADYTYYALYHSTTVGSQGNRTMSSIEGIDELLEKARASSDTDERMALYGNAETLVRENSANRPLMWVNLTAGMTDSVEGFALMPNSYHKLYNVKVYE